MNQIETDEARYFLQHLDRSEFSSDSSVDISHPPEARVNPLRREALLDRGDQAFEAHAAGGFDQHRVAGPQLRRQAGGQVVVIRRKMLETLSEEIDSREEEMLEAEEVRASPLAHTSLCP